MQVVDTSVQSMIAIGEANNVKFTADEVKSYLQELNEADEFDDVELDEATLWAVYGDNICLCFFGRGLETRAQLPRISPLPLRD